MFSTFCYVVLYYNIDRLFQTLYLPYINPTESQQLISTHAGLHFLLKSTSYFMMGLYTYNLIQRLLLYRREEKYSTALIFVYMNYILNIISIPNATLAQYELSRCMMWAFTCPIMLKMYIDANSLTFDDINAYYLIFAIVSNIFLTPFKGINPYYPYCSVALSIPCLIFLRTLYKYKMLQFTNLYIMTWSTFTLINVANLIGLLDPIHTHAAFNIADTTCKFICNMVVSQHNEQNTDFHENMDLQGANFISHVLKSIKQFETTNIRITSNCSNLIQYCKKQLMDKIPKTNNRLKLELLNKILPFDLDHDYVTVNSYGKGVNRQFDFICVMFMDIVNYTELANRYSGDVVFKLLDKIYNHFDNIIKKYPHLQKIETIGDAYMVVGDIYREKLNHKDVVKEMILLGLEFISEIKTIETPDGNHLCIRLGMNLGSVNIGILGNETPRLCVVGNTVNVASRLQSCADPDSIQMSTHVYEQTQDIDFGKEVIIEAKEKVFLKNIGTRITYVIPPHDEHR